MGLGLGSVTWDATGGSLCDEITPMPIRWWQDRGGVPVRRYELGGVGASQVVVRTV